LREKESATRAGAHVYLALNFRQGQLGCVDQIDLSLVLSFEEPVKSIRLHRMVVLCVRYGASRCCSMQKPSFDRRLDDCCRTGSG
jgi:hypothetical protein